MKKYIDVPSGVLEQAKEENVEHDGYIYGYVREENGWARTPVDGGLTEWVADEED